MLIANPIYDTVFKYLMADVDIAKGVISAIIGEEIDHLDFQSRENIYVGENDQFKFYHLDFIGRIRDARTGVYKEVLIELQKTNSSADIMRFRRYVGDRYRREAEMIASDGGSRRQSIPIITIYFLGFRISTTLPGVIKVNRRYIDVLTGKEIRERNEFIECLTHDSYVIQIPSLKLKMKTQLEYILSIFLQEKFIRDDYHLKDYPYMPQDELMKKIIRSLEMAAADGQLHRQLELEELAHLEHEAIAGSYEMKLRDKDKLLETKDIIIKQKNKVIDESREAIAQKDKALDESQETIAQKDKALEANKKEIKESRRAIAKKDKAIEDKDKYIEELLEKIKRGKKDFG